MKSKLTSIFIAVTLISVIAGPAARAAGNQDSGRYLGPEKTIHKIEYIQIKNFQNERLGRIREVSVDLTNGRVVEVFVISGDILGSGFGGTVRAVPPTALSKDPSGEAYFLDVSREDFFAAPAFRLSDTDGLKDQSRIAATYRRFSREPYFREDLAAGHEARIKRPIGYVQRGGDIVGMPVGNLQNETLGDIWALNYDFANGRVLTLVAEVRGNIKAKSVLAAREVKFDATRNAIVFDGDKNEFDEQPRYVAIHSVFDKMGDQHARYHEAYPVNSMVLHQNEQNPRNTDDDVRAGMPVDAAQ